MQRCNYVFLTGGLGNQLFQLATALSRTSENLILVTNLENARKSQQGHLDIEDFKLNASVLTLKKPKIWGLTKKGINYCLRRFASKDEESYQSLFDFLVLIVASSLISLNLREFIHVIVNRGLGLDPDLKTEKSGSFYIGYFQNFPILSEPNVRQRMKEISLKEDSDFLRKFINIAKDEKPLVVHVRLGDYKDSETFGILPEHYYANAIGKAWGSGQYNKIWLFSDEPEDAAQRIPSQYQNHVRVMPDFDGSTAVTFEVMRLGHGYVIANSTFSWWAANLSKSGQAQIFAPDRWFKAATSPNQILSEDWIKIRAWY